MRRSNTYGMKVLLVGVVVALVAAGEPVRADFTFGETTNIGAPVNTAYDEEMPSISADGLELYFQSRRPGGYCLFDLWVAKRESLDDPWGEPANLGPLVNSGDSNWSHGISADGLELYFEANRPGNYGGVDLWVAVRETIDEPWGEPVNLGPVVNSSVNDACPNISADGLELNFRSKRPGGCGEHDLWVSKRPMIDEPWGAPVNLGSIVNSLDYEGYPSLSADGLSLFFNSDRFNGARGWDFDIWLTRRKTKDSAWGEPINLGPGINTTHFEVAPSISADGHTLYFSDWKSQIRPGGCGGADIWQAPIIPIVDFNGDETLDAADIDIMIDCWGTDDSLCDIGPMPWGDGVVDVEDLIVLVERIVENRAAIADTGEVQ